MPFTNTAAAGCGLLAMYAMDMYRGMGGSLTPPAAPGLTAAGWVIRAYIVGNDSLLADGPLRLQGRTVFYGYLAQRGSEFAAAMRGTDGFVEWVEDAEFAAIPYTPGMALPAQPIPVCVEMGFWNLYRTMRLVGPGGEALGALAPATADLAGPEATVTVVGHSLGAALATYLALDLARSGLGGRVSACLFASPHPGNQAFADLFDTTVADYRLFNYILDVVPRVPLGIGYAALPRRTVLQPSTAEARIRVDLACNHHVICYCAMLDYEGTKRATTPVPAGEEDSAPCILGPETGAPGLAKQLVADLAGVVPV